MVSKSSTSSSKFRGTDTMANLTSKLMQLRRQMQSERVASVGEKLEKNSTRVQAYVSDLKALAASRNDFNVVNDSVNFLSLRMDNPLCKVGGLTQGSVDRDNVDNEEVVFSTTAKLPLIEKLPPYTTWIFLDRNQRMADDQSVVGRRRIYYDQHGSEALICSDSEEELGEPEGEKHEFSEVEDRILRMASEEFGVGDEVLNALTQFVGGTSREIQERCNMFMEKDRIMGKHKLQSSGEEGSEDNVFLDKSLSAALDSFDNLFCRRCLVFDCRLHGCSQILIYPSEKQSFPSDTEEDRKPCGDQCYLWLNGLKDLPKHSPVPLDGSQSKASNEEAHNLESKGKHTIYESTSLLAKASKVAPDDFLSSSNKRLKLGVQDPLDHSTTTVDQFPEVGPPDEHELQMSTSTPVHAFYKHNVDALREACNTIGNSIKAPHRRSEWKTFEKDLYLKGLEIFGRNSCLIARSLLPGLKTCKEVSRYMYGDGAVMPRGSSAILSSFFEDVGKADMDYLEPDMLVKSRVCRKRGRARKVKSSWKSAGHPSLWRRIADGKDQPCKQYTPCGCQSLCGKQCPCLKNGTCCEKYCGCSKGCKNRFRGCHCAKSQCKSRQCPCFAAGRECDPDVCRNCWVSCGDGSLGEPPKQGDGQCGNMRLLLRQQQRILLSKSDVAGWGAFLKNSVNKNDYLGEYTGELISHREADKRGKIYDRANSSFLFDLNDQYVLDAYRKGDKLKFANHSSTPNCYAKVMLVAGDHRVGIFANERIEAGEELFYDYRYGPDQAPAWARKPEASSKRDDSLAPQGRAKKHQSG
ncbi:histone-lysine N-methyltransferase EZA1 isoform X1 [Sesamum indicum]|uniref:Histone-lysine N-methyltransferase EZA1 isoform X1 n=2 Tax=Sesamum indicum TaxID=4182 RepID=A0A6I9TEY8_SESIN|nr:histone-lysine N-methyltransferase EZA1 isoform X1 [Sesamum indicum]